MKEYDILMTEENIKKSDNLGIGHNSKNISFSSEEKIKENKNRTKPLFKNIEITKNLTLVFYLLPYFGQGFLRNLLLTLN